MKTIENFRKVIEFLVTTQSGVTVRGNDCLTIETSRLIQEVSELIGELKVYKIISDQESFALVSKMIQNKLDEHPDFDNDEFLSWLSSAE